MSTVLCDCDLTLNSRPLTYVSDAANDLQVLTPTMFLHELKGSETPDLDILDKVAINSRYARKQ